MPDCSQRGVPAAFFFFGFCFCLDFQMSHGAQQSKLNAFLYSKARSRENPSIVPEVVYPASPVAIRASLTFVEIEKSVMFVSLWVHGRHFHLKPHEVVERVLVVSIWKLTSLFFGEFFDSVPRCVTRWVFLHPGKKISGDGRLKSLSGVHQ